jgi:ferric-dicitrate binding protein FerR (iron transport regulator)
MQQLLETTIGLPTNQADIETVNECVKLQIIEEDIKQALAWRKDTGKAPAKTITQLIGSIRNYRNKRIQDSNAATTRQEQASEVYG